MSLFLKKDKSDRRRLLSSCRFLQGLGLQELGLSLREFQAPLKGCSDGSGPQPSRQVEDIESCKVVSENQDLYVHTPLFNFSSVAIANIITIYNSINITIHLFQ